MLKIEELILEMLIDKYGIDYIAGKLTIGEDEDYKTCPECGKFKPVEDFINKKRNTPTKFCAECRHKFNGNKIIKRINYNR